MSKSADIHGKKDLPKNILVNWGAQGVQIVSGFLLPRMIDQQIGQEALGVWDLAWSVVSYFSLIQMGVTSSINRYVAFHRAKGEYDNINKVISSVALIMRGMSGIVLLLTLVTTYFLGAIYGERLGSYLPEARWLVFILGLDIVVQINATVYASILTGCHRWDWHNGIQAATNVLILVGMLLALFLGGGLVGIACVNLLGETVGRMVRFWAAYKICPWLEIKRKHFNRQTATEMLSFGGKTFVTQVSQLLMNSTVAMLIAAYLGPAALAVYSRPLSLIRNLGVFVSKYAMVFSPTISSFQGAGKNSEVKDLALQSTCYGLFLSVPAAVFIMLFGDEILRVWMGQNYVNRALISLITLGFMSQIFHIPLFKALVSLNAHGPVGWVNLAGAAIAILASFLSLAFMNGSLVAVALCVGIVMTFINAIYLPVYSAKCLGISLPEFYRAVWARPLYLNLPYAVCLVIGRVFYDTGFKSALLWSAFVALTLLVTAYWKSVLPLKWKTRLLPKFYRAI